MMMLQDDLKELQKLRIELERQKLRVSRRRFLKVFLIGFFIWRDAENRISAIKSRYDEIVSQLQGYFRGIDEMLGELQKHEGVDAYAARVNEKSLLDKLLSMRQDFRFLVTKEAKDALTLIGKSKIGDFDKIISEATEEYVNQRIHSVGDEVKNIENSGTYLTYLDKDAALWAIESLEVDFEHFGVIEQGQELINRYREVISAYNNEFVERCKKDYETLFKNDNFELDEEQKNAVVTDDKNNLVVAGAGAGKTEVLITRIAYLIKRKPDGVLPNRILAIAYQNKDVKQIEHRLAQRYDIAGVDIKTFHKLGKMILEKSGKKLDRNSIIDENKKSDTMRSLYEKRLGDSDSYKAFLQYVKVLHDEKEDTSSANKADTFEYARQRRYFSIDNTSVKSRAEKEIMDFFLMNKLNGDIIDVDYEPDMPGFRPDFGLPKYDLFVEHWALNEKGEVPEWFDQTTEEYKEGIRFKKEWFSKNNKLLVETFAFEYDEANPEPFLDLLKNRVIEKLRTRSDDVKYEFEPLSYDELVEIAWGPYKDPVDEISGFVTNAKTYGLSPSKIIEKLQRERLSKKQLAFAKIAVKIFADYQDYLAKTGKIDFEDMINEAVAELDKNKSLLSNAYDHILIDEYQDISAQRYRLIKSLIDHNPRCRLFCVGDDWQSIMSFSGSNVDFFVNFGRYFENPVVTKISTNYRCAKPIVDAGADLIKRNSYQIPKTSISKSTKDGAIKILRSPHQTNYRMQYFEQTAEDCLDRIVGYLEKGIQPRDILVLSRFIRTKVHGACEHHHVIRLLLDKASERGVDMLCDDARDEGGVRVISVHKSKGLEAKVVFVLNVIKDAYGFPSEIEDNSIYAIARENYPKQDLKEEERRLFYVAMTRAKEDLILYTWEPFKSEFLEEIGKYTKEERLNY